MWQRHQAMLSILVPNSTLRMHLDSLLIYRSARVHTRDSSIAMWQTSSFNQHKISLSVNQSPTPKGVVLLGMVLRVRLLEVGGSTRGALGKAFFPFTFGGGGGLGKAFFPFTFLGALGKAFFPFTFFFGVGALGGGAKRKCYVNPAFSGIPKKRGTKSEVAASPLPSRGPKNGRKCYANLAFSGIPKKKGTKSEVAASPLPSRGLRRGPKCYVTPAFSGVPNAKHGDKIRSGPQVGTSPKGMHFQ